MTCKFLGGTKGHPTTPCSSKIQENVVDLGSAESSIETIYEANSYQSFFTLLYKIVGQQFPENTTPRIGLQTDPEQHFFGEYFGQV